MTEKQIAQILKYSSPTELFVVTHKNTLELLTCPFEVEVKFGVGNLLSGEVVLVDEIKVTRNLITVFVIESKPYYYYHFEILIN